MTRTSPGTGTHASAGAPLDVVEPHVAQNYSPIPVTAATAEGDAA